ncbi:MAG: ATP-binding protein [Bacteroidota bacterium]
MKPLLLVGICWCLLTPARAQLRHSLDSLRAASKELWNDSVKVTALNELSRRLVYVHTPEAIDYATRALDISNNIDYARGRAHAYRNFAAISAMQENFSQAVEFAHKSLVIFEKLNDRIGIGNCYLTLGRTYILADDYAQSYRYHLVALDNFKRSGNINRVAVAQLNMAELYYKLEKLDSAELSLNEAYVEFFKTKDTSALAVCYKTSGMIELARGDVVKGEKYFLKVVETSLQLGRDAQKDPFIKACLYLSDIYRESERFDEQLKMLLLARDAANGHSYLKEYQRVSKALSAYYISQKKFTEANRYIHEYFKISDSLSRLQLKDRMALASNAFQSMKAQEERELLERDKELQSHIIQRQRNQLLYTFIILTLLIVLISGLYFYVQFQRKVYRLLKKQKEEIDLKSKELLKINSTKDKFFSIVAHDLKSPLDSLLGFSKLITTHISALSKEEIREMGQSLQLAVGNALKMAENLIAWSQTQMKTTEFKPQNVKLGAVLQQICEIYRHVADRKEVTLNCHPVNGLSVFADENQLSFIVRNLVNNAIKFTPSGGTVWCSAEQLNDNYIRIVIRDNGVGIEEARIRKLFSVGKKNNTIGTAGEKGTGLGLVLCQEFTHQNRGHIHVHSLLDRGTTFFVELPVAPESTSGI